LSPFSVHHYLGFLETYVGADQRKSVTDYTEWAHYKEGPSCNAIRWLRLFYNTFGQTEAARLLMPPKNTKTRELPKRVNP